MKSTFISIVSHELRTPVALIKGYASTLRRDDAKWDKHTISDSLAVIEEEADRLSKMIDDLLDASRLQAGGLSLSRGDVSLPALAKRVAEKFANQSGQHTIVTDFPEYFPIILADETRVEQVVINLVSNALKYAPKGEIRIAGQVRPEQVIICVSDEGPGIEAKDLPHIFDRFYRSTQKAPGWDCTLPAPSSKPMADASGLILRHALPGSQHRAQSRIQGRGFVFLCRARVRRTNKTKKSSKTESLRDETLPVRHGATHIGALSRDGKIR
jgi:signal transduction histidine kinase